MKRTSKILIRNEDLLQEQTQAGCRLGEAVLALERSLVLKSDGSLDKRGGVGVGVIEHIIVLVRAVSCGIVLVQDAVDQYVWGAIAGVRGGCR